MKEKILITYPLLPEARLRAERDFEALISDKELSTEEVLDWARSEKVSALIVTMRQKFDEETLSRLPREVKVIATTSVGYDHFDVEAARRRGIQMTNTPDVLTDCTADLAMMLLLNACRRGREYLEIMEEGWGRTYGLSEMLGLKVGGRLLGILGMGRIGQALAERARGFGMKILYSNRRRLPPDIEKGATYFANFREMLPHCEVLSLNAPSTSETRGIMNEEAFSLLPEGSVLVNVARGDLVDESALIGALRSKRLAAAGLDVFRNEPRFDRRLADFPNVFLTPHMGSATRETRLAMSLRCLENVSAALAGRRAPDAL